MLSKVRWAINRFGLLDGVKTLAVAVSGGADSVTLLKVSLELMKEYNITVFAAHFNHRLRGAESDRDMIFVQNLCDNLGVKLICGEGDVKTFAKQKKISTELAARNMRYDFFDKLDADAVATAHTASDNLETIIFNLSRGSAIGGLCGIPPKRDKYIRPLIFCTRDDVENYCSDNNLSFVTDSTNLSDDYSRNIIRHNIIPKLKEINSAAEENASKTALSLSIDRDMLDGISRLEYEKRQDGEGLDVNNFITLNKAVANRIIRAFAKQKTGITPDFKHINNLYDVAAKGGRCSLEGGYIAQRQKAILKIDSLKNQVEYKVNIEKIKSEFIKKDKKINNLLLNNMIDCDKIVGKLEVRTRVYGEKIRLAGHKCTKTLKKLYNENGIPPMLREKLPVIADDVGAVWVCSMGVAERAAPDKNTQFVYKISYEIISGGNNIK